MRDRDDRAVEAPREQLHPGAALVVEVRLGLVEQQHVGLLLEAGGERDELALTAREAAGRQGQLVRRESPSSRRAARALPVAPGPPAASKRSSVSSWRASTRVIRSRSAITSALPSCVASSVSSRSSSTRSGRASSTVSSGVRSSPAGCWSR